MSMINNPNVINDEALQGDDSQDPADHFLVRNGEVEDDAEMDIGDSGREDLFMSDTEAD